MQFSFISLFASVVTLATLANAAPNGNVVTPKPQAISVGKVWVDGGMKGASQDITVTTLPSSCINFSGKFQDSISSIRVNSGIVCTFFLDFDCAGAALQVFADVDHLGGTNFADSISSVQCQST